MANHVGAEVRACVAFGDRAFAELTKTLRVLQLADNGRETRACVAFGGRTFAEHSLCFLRTRPNITPAHIWRPPMAKKTFERTFTDGFRNNTQFESKSPKGMITRPYAHAGFAPGKAKTSMLTDENDIFHWFYNV